MAGNSDYYVYVYIDPRNHEEFYYGKGRGTRKDSHLKEKSDSEKATRIANIRQQGLEPIIRVIARHLSQEEALLIEKTLLWKLGRWTTNVSTGHFAKKFRPHDTLHKELFGFDYANAAYYYNVGENRARNWDDYKKYGYISAGWGVRYRDAMQGFRVGDLVVAHLKGYGYVGIGRIKEEAKMIRDVEIDGTPLLDLPMIAPDANHDCDDVEQSEYACIVKWIKRIPREEAKWKKSAGLFTTPIIRASLDRQPKTIRFLEREFDISFKRLLK